MTVSVIHGDMREVLRQQAEDGVRYHACVTDPPYGLGFMSKAWDKTGIAFRPETWRAVYDVLLPGAHLLAFGGPRTSHRMVCAIEDAGFEIRDTLMWLFASGFPKNKNALKPAHEPIVLARKPLDGTVALNVLKHGVGGLNVDACRVAADTTTEGRWPANLCHDNSDEVLAAFAAFGEKKCCGTYREDTGPSGKAFGTCSPKARQQQWNRGDTGTAARFFYRAKAGPDDRLNSKHPTIKPIALMRWLIRLVTSPHGRILDPFAGSGSTGMAAMAEGFDATLIELEEASVRDIEYRLQHVCGDDTPLFRGSLEEAYEQSEIGWPTHEADIT